MSRSANPKIPLLETVYYRQLVIMGSRGLPALRFPALFEMISAGRLNMEKLIKTRIALEDAGAALAKMDNHEDVGITLIDRF
jgi:alcohol dehydrogenase